MQAFVGGQEKGTLKLEFLINAAALKRTLRTEKRSCLTGRTGWAGALVRGIERFSGTVREPLGEEKSAKGLKKPMDQEAMTHLAGVREDLGKL